jgi:hypothetical protein
LYENFLITQGSSLTIAGTLKDAAGEAITGVYDGSETLQTSLWPGGPRPASFTPTTSWLLPADGTFLIAISDEETALLYSGVYEGVTRLLEGGTAPDAFYFKLTVAPGPAGIPPTPTAATITRLVVETELIDRASALLLLCGKTVLADGENRHLTGPIGYSLSLLGVTPAIPGVVSDDDLALVPVAQYFLLCDLAEYRLIKSLLGSFAQPDQTSGNTKIQLNSLIERYRQQMLGLEQQYAAYLGKYRATLTAGSIRVRSSSCDWARGNTCDF